ncbi:MAG: helix-turn-helix transcriptional regulator [Sneathiella sp.]
MKLKTWLDSRKIKAVTFAENVGVTHSTIGRYVSGDRFPRPEILRRIEVATGGKVTANDFLDLQKSA